MRQLCFVQLYMRQWAALLRLMFACTYVCPQRKAKKGGAASTKDKENTAAATYVAEDACSRVHLSKSGRPILRKDKDRLTTTPYWEKRELVAAAAAPAEAAAPADAGTAAAAAAGASRRRGSAGKRAAAAAEGDSDEEAEDSDSGSDSGSGSSSAAESDSEGGSSEEASSSEGSGEEDSDG